MNNDNFYIKLGNSIATERKKRSISQSDLAQQVGLSSRVLCSYEKGTYRIPAESLAAISNKLGLSISDIVGDSQKEDQRTVHAKLMQRFYKLEVLPEDERKTIIQILDTLLAKAK